MISILTYLFASVAFTALWARIGWNLSGRREQDARRPK